MFAFIVKSRLSYREWHKDKLGMGQNDIPEFIGDNFETFVTLPENINTHLKQGSQFCKELAFVHLTKNVV